MTRGLPTVCSEPGCDQVQPCPRPGHSGSHWRKWDGPDYGRDWPKISARVIREEPLCTSMCEHADCRHSAPRCSRRATEAGHIVPLSKGGTNERGNLHGQCHECNQRDARAESVKTRKAKAR